MSIPNHISEILSGKLMGVLPEHQMNLHKGPGVYCIINKITLKLYIGISVRVNKRKIAHLNYLRKNKHPNKALQIDYNVLKDIGFYFVVIEKTEEVSLSEREQYFMDMFKNKYNVILSSDRRQITPQHRANLSKAHIGIKHTDEAKRKIGLASKGNKHRLGHKPSQKQLDSVTGNKYSLGRVGPLNKLTGRRRPADIIAKCVKTKRERYGSSLPGNYKSLLQYSSSGVFIMEWTSVKHASAALGIRHNSISRVASTANIRNKTAGGFIFKYKCDEYSI